jgi:hypothetical protein
VRYMREGSHVSAEEGFRAYSEEGFRVVLYYPVEEGFHTWKKGSMYSEEGFRIG